MTSDKTVPTYFLAAMDELEQRYKSLISQQNSEDSDLSDSDEELSPLVMDIAEALKPTIKQRSLNEENSETDTCSGSDENIEISKNDDSFIGGKRTGVDDMKKLKNFVNFYKVTKDFEQKFKKCTKSKHMLHFSMSSLSDVKKAISETDKVSHTRSNALRKWNSEMKLNSCDDLQFNIKDIRHHLLGDDQYQGLEALEFFDEPVISPTKVNMAYCDSYLDESFNANEKDPLSFDSKEDIKSKIDLILKTESPKKGLIKLRKITDLVEEKPLKATTKRLNIPVKFDLKSLKVIGQTKCPQNLVSSPKPIEPLKMAQTNVSSASKAYKCYSDNDSCINDIAAADDDFNPIIQAAFSLAEKETPPTMNSQKLPTKQIVLKHGQIVNISHGKTNTPVHTDPITNKSNTQNNPFSGIISHTVGEINNFTHETVTTMPSNPRLTYISTRIKSEPSGRDSVPQERAPPNRQQNTNISNANTMPQRTYGNTKSNLNIPVKPVCMTSSSNANTTPPKQLHNINSYILSKPVSIKTSPNATMISKPPILMNTASKSNIFLEGKQTVVSTPDNNKTSPPRRIIQMKENGKLGMFTSVSQILQDQTTAPQPSWFTSFGSGNVLLNVAPQSHSGTLQLSNISAEPTVGYVIVNDLDTPKSVIDKSAVTQTTNGAIIGNIELVKPSKATDNDLKSAKNEVAGSNYQRSKTAENISSVKNKSDILNTQKTHLATVQQQPQFSKVKDFKQDSSGKGKQNQSTESTVRGTQLKFIPITKKSVPTSSTIAKTKILFRKDLLEKDEFTKELFGEVIQESNLILFNNLNKYFCTWCRSG
ncbi:hypothetical protein M8J75_004074 [Diaphorina citri]|nr:hypothetical protein M8J75_004074 [Diaphorina citri]